MYVFLQYNENSLLISNYQDDAGEILRQRKLGFSFVRLLPKDTGVRPIVNLRKRKAVNRVGLSSKRIYIFLLPPGLLY